MQSLFRRARHCHCFDEGATGGGGSYIDAWLQQQACNVSFREKALEDGFDILDDEGEIMPGNEDLEKKVGALSISERGSKKEEAATAEAEGGDDDDDEYADMADFEDDNVMEDEAAAIATSTPTSTAAANENIIKVRSYDVSITYDKYYQTPRVWLTGYADDGSNTPLAGDEMMQDVISDYAHRTVTVENHPHVSGPHASIHPCQHGAVMKTIVTNLTKDGSDGEEREEPGVEMYLFIFLFVSSMIPTISYDFTMDVSASTKK